MSHTPMIQWKSSIFHDGGEEFIFPRFPTKGEEVIIRIRIHSSNPILKIYLRTTLDGEEYNLPMMKEERNSAQNKFSNFVPNPNSDSDSLSEFNPKSHFQSNSGNLQHYRITLPILTKHFRYRFRMITPEEQFWLTSLGIQSITPTDDFDFHLVTDLNNQKGQKWPNWIDRAIFYQIFPERFYDGDPTNNVKPGEITRHNDKSEIFEWDQVPGEYGKNNSSLSFYGGDIIGIQKKLPYLLDLGVNALYLNPIFTSPSNHKYDTLNYKEIDPHFGSNEIFSNFVAEFHKCGFHVILDAVINHSSEDHPWFSGARQSPESHYREYYYFNSQDLEDYEGWKGHKLLPRLNFSSNLLRDEIYRNRDSILQFWMLPPYSVDGWRFDCANMIGNRLDDESGNSMWKEIRIKLKEIKPNCYLLGESFYDGSDLVSGEKLDAITNYSGFYSPLVRWLTQKDGFQTHDKGKFGGHSSPYPFTLSDMIEQMNHFRGRIPFQLQNIQINLLDSHDVPRFYSLVNENETIMRLAVAFMFTYPGIPMIYYGDEVGLTGLGDPDNRRPMEWREDLWNKSLLQWYRLLIRIRKKSLALQMGSFQVLQSITGDNDSKNLEILAYVRYTLDEIFLIILKKESTKCQLKLPLEQIGVNSGSLVDEITGIISPIDDGYFNVSMDLNESVFIGKIMISSKGQ